MIHVIDSHKLDLLYEIPCYFTDPAVLRREGRVFFIGGNLPVYSTLETMYESYCQESTELFYITFGNLGAFDQNLEMIRQIKRNFSIRLMGQVSNSLSASQIEQVYLAGLDVLNFLPMINNNDQTIVPDDNRVQWQNTFSAAVSVFPRWSVVSTIIVSLEVSRDIQSEIKELLSLGIVPLLSSANEKREWNTSEISDHFSFLTAEWHRYRVPLKPIIPLLRLTTPFVFNVSSGLLRDAIDKLQDRRILATSDIRRHLRTSGAVASFESAGL